MFVLEQAILEMMRPTTSHAQLLDTKAYIADLTVHIDRARTRINLMSLIFTDDISTHELVEAVERAAKRGVEVNIAVDWFTYGEFGGYFSPLKRVKAPSRVTSAMVKRFKKSGATFTWLGSRRKLNPFGGVTHIKWSIVDNIVYIFGGINLYQEGIESIDYMFRLRNKQLADQITHQHHAITRSGRTYPGYMSESGEGLIYIDSGKRHESIIYDRICHLTKKAAHVLVVTQYCPSGMLAPLLLDKSDIYYNQPRSVPYPTNMLNSYTQQRTGLRSLFTRAGYLHAKYMIFTMPDASKIAVTGSHNFAHSGVAFGTREVALETTNPVFIRQLETFHKKYVA